MAAAPPRGAPLRLVHVGLHERRNANAGDTLLFQALRDLIEQVTGPVEWTLRQLWDPLQRDDAVRLGQHHDGIIVGGGGLLLRDQDGSDVSRSGWQWNVDATTIATLPIPLALLGVGYNRFRDQPDFDPPFTDNIRTLVDTAAFLGLRNSGSIRAVERYLEPEQRGQLHLFPCPTTVLRQLYGVGADRSGPPVVGLNIAFDRAHLRFGHDPERVFRAIATACRGVNDRGLELRLLLHKAMDAQILPWLDEADVSYSVAELADASPRQIVDAYLPLHAVVGMRGHSQLIPFGLGIPIVSLISHDKLAWFLEDLGQPGWGIEITEPDLAGRLLHEVDRAMDQRRHSEVDALQRRWWDTTQRAVVSAIAALGDARLVGAV